ncbi:phage terminase small subunit [Clostridium ihumii]|uniref:phage terminase small subunit n=1 Tax=Clostridium ihumii TaxID=1470356 RepID=UPI000553D392|nr:phage terminase small subunit [Clostridium ihumii]
MENRELAFNIYKDKEGKIKPKEIAAILNEDPANIRKWKNNDKWDKKLGIRKSKAGAPKGNKNAIGNSGGGAVKGNINAFKHGEYINPERFNNKGFLAKYLPKTTQNIMKEIQENGLGTLDILWTNIEIHFTSIIRSQKIMYVKSHKDLTKELKKSKVKSNNRKTEKTNTNSTEEEYEYVLQFAWDKQERFLNSQSKAMKTLEGMIKTYEELLHKNWDLATEEQKLRIEKLKAEIKILTIDDEEETVQDDGFINALNGTAQEDWADEEEE